MENDKVNDICKYRFTFHDLGYDEGADSYTTSFDIKIGGNGKLNLRRYDKYYNNDPYLEDMIQAIQYILEKHYIKHLVRNVPFRFVLEPISSQSGYSRYVLENNNDGLVVRTHLFEVRIGNGSYLQNILWEGVDCNFYDVLDLFRSFGYLTINSNGRIEGIDFRESDRNFDVENLTDPDIMWTKANNITAVPLLINR